MEFEQQKPITDEYRRGWEHIYMRNGRLYENSAPPQPRFNPVYYPNGCPILSEGPQKDDL
jgi:hypothetical protein